MIDNGTGRISEASQVVCDEAVSWNATVPLNTYSVDTPRAGIARRVPRASSPAVTANGRE